MISCLFLVEAGGVEPLPLPAVPSRIWGSFTALIGDEKKSRINAGVASVPRLGYICPQCGQLRGVSGVSKVGSKSGL